MVEVAVRNNNGLLVRDGLRYPIEAARREIANLAKLGTEAAALTLDGTLTVLPAKRRH